MSQKAVTDAINNEVGILENEIISLASSDAIKTLIAITDFTENSIIRQGEIVSGSFPTFKTYTVDNTANNSTVKVYCNFRRLGDVSAAYNYFSNLLVQYPDGHTKAFTLYGWKCIVVPKGFKITFGLNANSNEIYTVSELYDGSDTISEFKLRKYTTEKVASQKTEIADYKENSVIRNNVVYQSESLSAFKVGVVVAGNTPSYVNFDFHLINNQGDAYNLFFNLMIADKLGRVVVLANLEGWHTIVVPPNYTCYVGCTSDDVVYEVNRFYGDNLSLSQILKVPVSFEDSMIFGKLILSNGYHDSSNFSVLQIGNIKEGEIYYLQDSGLKRNQQFYLSSTDNAWHTLSISNNSFTVPANAIVININYENGINIDTYRGHFYYKNTGVLPASFKNEVASMDEIRDIDILMYSTQNLLVSRTQWKTPASSVFYKLTEDDFTDNSVILPDGTIRTNTGYKFKVSKAINSTDIITTTNNVVILEADFTFGQNYSYFKNVAIYKGEKLIKAYRLDGYRAIPIPVGYSVRICVAEDADVYLGSYRESNIRIRRNPIVWVGTSIPEGLMYPITASWNNGFVCYNNCLGSSSLRFNKDYRASSSLNDGNIQDYEGKNLSATVEELQTCYAGSSLSSEAKEKIYGYSWERRIKPYIDGTLDNAEIVVIDHGRNDKANIVSTVYQSVIDGTVDWDSTDRNNFIGAFNYLCQEIWKINPFVRIIVGGYFQNSPIDDGDKVCYVQEAISKHYGLWLLDSWRYTGISDVIVKGTSSYLNNFNSEYSKDYTPLEGYSDEEGNISMFQIYCPDGIHPHTDRTGHSNRLFNAVYTKLIRDIISYNDVKQ